MEWTDEGIVLGMRRHGEANAILELMTREHGRHLGLVRGGAGARLRPVLQPGNTVGVVWRARLDEHLGHYTVESLAERAAAFLAVPHALYGLTHLCALVRLLPERDPHPAIHASLDAIVAMLDEPQRVAYGITRFELQLLAELGFGLDLSACAATGTRDDLVYVSPKSGRAVSRLAGEPWRTQLLPLPQFLRFEEGEGLDATEASGHDDVSLAELIDGLALTAFFLDRHVLAPRGLHFLDAREKFIAALTRQTPRGAVA
jgi:DNA repair protein RecO (recombination protein O)